MQNIGEMTALCRKLFASDVADGDNTHIITLFSGVIKPTIRPWVPDLPLDQFIDFLRLVRAHKPELRNAQYVLAFSLAIRYCKTFVNDDYDEAASILDEIVASRSPGEGQDEFVAIVHRVVTGLAVDRSKTHNTPEYSEEAMYRARAFLSSFPEDPFVPLIDHSLEDTAKQRFYYFGSIEGLEASSGTSWVSQVAAAFGGLDESDYADFDKIYKNAILLEEILCWIKNNETLEIEQVIEDGRTILASSDPSSPFAFYVLELFGLILFEAFKRTSEVRYLDQSMNTLGRVLEYPFAQHIRLGTLRILSSHYSPVQRVFEVAVWTTSIKE